MMSDKNRLSTALLVCCLLFCVLSTVIISTALTNSNVSNNNTTNFSTNSTSENNTNLSVPIIKVNNPSMHGLAPLNPAFIEYQKKMVIQNNKIQNVRIKSIISNVNESNLIPPPVDLSHLSKINRIESTPFEPKYDLRTKNKVTNIKNQSNAGVCWAFATYGSLESYLLTSENWNFSENNMKNLLSENYSYGFNRDANGNGDTDIGGNQFMSTAYLASWNGPVNSNDDPYNDTSYYSPTNLSIQKHVQNVYFIPERENAIDNYNIKQQIKECGGVTADMFIYRFLPIYNVTSFSYYYNASVENVYRGDNHAVTLVGWDDDFNKTNFYRTPPSDGAFIVKNSYGEDFGESGYFYISYYDSNLGRRPAYTYYGNGEPLYYGGDNACMSFTAENNSNYQHIYQYDPLGWTEIYGFGHTGACFNVFTANSNEVLKAVSFYTTDSNCDYQIYITRDNDTELTPVGNGTQQFAGYHTVSLNSSILLKKGQSFVVELILTTPNYDYPIALEASLPYYSSKATANASESFVFNGTGWQCATEISPNSNVCIKAFTDNAVAGDPPSDPIVGTPTADFTSNITNGYAPLTVQFSDTSVNETDRYWNFGEGANVTELNPVHTYNTAGNYTVTLTAINGSNTNSTSSTISVFGQSNRESPVYAYVTNSFITNTVQVVDIEQNKVNTPINTGSSPQEITISKDRQKAYVTVTNGIIGSVSVINTTTNSIIGNILTGSSPQGVAITPDGSKLYVTDRGVAGGGFVSVINTATNTVTNNLPITGAPWSVAITPDGTKAYIALSGANSVSVVNTATDQVKTTIQVGSTPKSVAISPDGKTAYIANTGSNYISIIDTTTDSVTGTLTVGNAPAGIVVKPDGKRVYVANSGSHSVSIIDSTINQIIATVDVGATPIGIAISPDGRTVCTANKDGGTMSVINTTNNLVTSIVNVGYSPNGIAINSQPIVNTGVVDFTVTPVSSQAAPFVVYFNGAASQGNIINMHWNFGDGKSINSTNVGATIANSYTVVGTYTVTLTVTYDDLSTKSVSKNVNVVATPHKPINADFTGAPLYGISSLDVKFTDNSTGADNWFYVFGDNGNVIARNPTHLYTTPGSYSVVQIAFNNTLSQYDAIVKRNYVNVVLPDGTIPQTPNTIINVPTSDVKINDFSASVTSGAAPLNIIFNSNVTGLENAVTWTWIFEPVSSDYYSIQPISTNHTFTRAGKFDITLIITNKTGAVASMTKTGYITVTAPNSGFTSTELSSSSNNGVSNVQGVNSLTNVAIPIIPIGVVNTEVVNTNNSSNSSNPINVANSSVNTSVPTSSGIPASSSYSTRFSGLYGVTRSSEYSSSTPPTTFTLYGHVNSEINFQSIINTEFTGVAWNFQDGKGSHAVNPTHTYTKPGIYAVTLTAINTNGVSVKKVVGKVIIE